MIEKVVTISRSFQEADQADREFYRGLTPTQRLEVLVQLNRRWQVIGDVANSTRLERVYRVVKLPGR